MSHFHKKNISKSVLNNVNIEIFILGRSYWHLSQTRCFQILQNKIKNKNNIELVNLEFQIAIAELI